MLSPRGRLVNLGSSAAAEASFGSATLRSGVLSVLGYTNNALTNEQKATALSEILKHAAAGRLDRRPGDPAAGPRCAGLVALRPGTTPPRHPDSLTAVTLIPD